MTKTSGINIREISLEVLIKVLEEGEYSSAVLQKVLTTYQYLEKQERAFLSRLCEGTIERALELDYIINQFSKVKVKKMKPVIRNILRMGVYQMKYMEQVPDSAACNEAVKLAQKKGFHNLKGFVNGVLRNIGRNMDHISYPSMEKQPKEYLSVTYSTPAWIVEKWIVDYGFDITKKMLEASMEEKPTSIRCNTKKISVEQLKAKLEAEGVTVEDGNYVDTALSITDYNYLNKLESFQNGYFTVQDESSMMVALAAGVDKGDTVVDVCAAPGGKSLHVAELLVDSGLVSARDLTERKVNLIEENIKRLGFTNVQAKAQDALCLDEEFVEKADVVIADLPCSGLGVIGKKTDIKYKATEQGLKDLEKLQRDILKVVTSYVKPGGILIYSTCTVNPRENEENAIWFQENFPFELESLDAFLPETVQNENTKKGYIQFFPGIHKTDGFFLARFRKSSHTCEL